MANDDFNPTQLTTLRRILKEAFTEERVYTEKMVRQRLGERFLEERAHTKQMLDDQSLEDRKYLIGLFRQEFDELRQLIRQIDTRDDEDARASGADISALNKRLSKLEHAFEKFVAMA